jgi:phospholipid N-methyltransferase
LAHYDLDSVDCIISAIPFVNLTEELSFKILNNAKKVLKSNGTFIQMHYSLLERKMYKSIFGNLQINFEPLNIPPAFVFVCTKTN